MRVAAVALLCVAAIAGANAADAVVRMWPTIYGNTNGTVTFTLRSDGAYDVLFNVKGFAPNTEHGVHIHEFGDVSSADAGAAAAHFNPYNEVHACPAGDPRHVGDLGNITSDANGEMHMTLTTDIRASGQSLNLTFDGSANFVNANAVGRGLIIHTAFDNCVSQPVGAAGTRMSQGVIGIANTATAVGSEYQGWAALYAKMVDPSGAAIGSVWIRNTSMVTTSGVSTGIEVYAQITGVAPGSVHGFHLHQYGDLSVFGPFTQAGAHFNPVTTNQHGLPYEATNTHMGDLGNVIADSTGSILHHAFYPAVTFQGLAQNIIGRAVMLHSYMDQGRQWTLDHPGPPVDQTGGAGFRVGMGVLGLANANRFPTDFVTRTNTVAGYARLFGTAKRPGASGTVKVEHGDDNLAKISVHLEGLDNNKLYALHIHDFGDLTANDGTSAGGHYNPHGFPHKCYPATGQRHVGDIGNMQNTTASGTLDVVVYRDWISLAGENSTIGRAIIVHQWADDCQTQPTGQAGSRYLYGVLGSVAPVASVLAFNASATNPGPKTPLTGLMAWVVPTSDAPSGTSPQGTVYITTDPADSANTIVYLNITGVAPSTRHGFHIHAWGDWQLSNGNGAGGHWNPNGFPHALPGEANNRHAGDLGNVDSDANGNIGLTIKTLASGTNIQLLAGKAVVLHADPDQGASAQPTGAAGLRIAMGVLGILNPATVIPVPTQTNVVITSSSTGDACPPDQICAGAMASPSVAALIAAAVLLAVIRRD